VTRPVTPRAREDLAVVVLDGEAVIYDEETQDLHHLNPTATVVFSLCEGTSTIREIAEEISQTFRVPANDIEAQIRPLLRQLRRAGLLEPARNGDGNARTTNGHG